LYRKNTAGQFIYFQLNKTTDGTGLTGATVSVRRCIDGTFAAATGTVTEDTGGGSSAGFYKFAMSQADTNGNDIGYAFTATGAITVEKTIVTTAADPTDSVRFGLTALPNAAANGVGGVPVLDANSLVDVDVKRWLATAVTAATAGIPDVNAKNINNVVAPTLTGDAFARLGAPAGATVSADIAEIEAETDAIQTSTAGLTFTTPNQVDCNMQSINNSAVAASTLAENVENCPRGTCSGGTLTTAVVSSMSNPVSLASIGQLIGRTILFDADTTTPGLQSQQANITASTAGATPTITFPALTNAPANGDTFSIV
jgi:hypothetical protein